MKVKRTFELSRILLGLVGGRRGGGAARGRCRGGSGAGVLRIRVDQVKLDTAALLPAQNDSNF